MNRLSKRYFLFGWNDNDEWHDENDWELGLMITGLSLHNDKSISSLVVDWDTIVYEKQAKILTDFQHLGIFEVENFRNHKDEFRIEVDDTSKLQYCRFKPRTTCVRLIKDVDVEDLEELNSWLSVFDIMSFNEYKDEYYIKKNKLEPKKELTETSLPKEKKQCEVQSRPSLYEDTPEEVRNQILYLISLIIIIVVTVVHFK